MDIFYILIWIVFKQVYKYVKTHQPAHLIFVHINKYKLYLSKRENGKTVFISCEMRYATHSEDARGRNDQTLQLLSALVTRRLFLITIGSNNSKAERLGEADEFGFGMMCLRN